MRRHQESPGVDRPDGGELSEGEWRDTRLQAFGYRLCGLAMDEVDEKGEPITDDTLLVLFNAAAETIQFVLPDAHPGKRWESLVDTTSDEEAREPRRFDVGSKLELLQRALLPLRGCEKRS